MSTSSLKQLKKVITGKENKVITEERKKFIQTTESFYKKQQKFFTSANQSLNSFIDIISHQIKYFTEHWDQSGMSEEDCLIVKESFSIMKSIFTNLMKSLQCFGDQNFKQMFHQLNDVKNHLTDDNDELVMKKYSQLEHFTQWNTPVLFDNFFRPFVTMFDAGSVYFNENDEMSLLVMKAQESKQQYIISYSQPSALYCNKTIQSILETEHRQLDELPIAIENIYNYLYQTAHNTVGIFREITSANKQQINDLYLRMAITSFEDLPPDLVASVFKKFLMELPSHIVGENETRIITDTYMKEGIAGLKSKINELSIENLTMFKYLIKLLNKIASYADVNLMNAKNLAVCLTPTVFSIGDTDTVTLTKALKVLGDIIDHFNDIFPDDIDFLVYRKSRVLKRATKMIQSNDDQVIGMMEKKIARRSQMNHQKKKSKSKLIRERSLHFEQMASSSSINPHSLIHEINSGTSNNTYNSSNTSNVSQKQNSSTSQNKQTNQSNQSNINKQINQSNQSNINKQINQTNQSSINKQINQYNNLNQNKQPPPPNPYPASRIQTMNTAKPKPNSSTSPSIQNRGRSSSASPSIQSNSNVNPPNRNVVTPKTGQKTNQPSTMGLSISERISMLQQDSK